MTLWEITANGQRSRWLDPDDYPQNMIELFAKQHYGNMVPITVRRRPIHHPTGRLGSGEEFERPIAILAD